MYSMKQSMVDHSKVDTTSQLLKDLASGAGSWTAETIIDLYPIAHLLERDGFTIYNSTRRSAH